MERFYDYVRNEDLNANEFFANRNGVKRPLYRYNVAGYTIGGPFAIPGKFTRWKDKLFFFFGQEFVNLTAPGSLQQVTVPTALERQGDFSQTLDVSGKLVPITDPLSKAVFPGNLVPQNRIDPNGQKLLQVFPSPNITDRTITKGTITTTSWKASRARGASTRTAATTTPPTSSVSTTARAFSAGSTKAMP